MPHFGFSVFSLEAVVCHLCTQHHMLFARCQYGRVLLVRVACVAPLRCLCCLSRPITPVVFCTFVVKPWTLAWHQAPLRRFVDTYACIVDGAVVFGGRRRRGSTCAQCTSLGTTSSTITSRLSRSSACSPPSCVARYSRLRSHTACPPHIVIVSA